MSSTKILKEMCYIDAVVGKPYIKSPAFFADTLIILIGFVVEMRGQAMIAFEKDIACDIASKMIMMPVTELDELAQSAIGELGNMIMGNAATIFSTKGYVIDITPPSVCHGDMTITQSYTQNICVPIHSGDEVALELNIAVIAEQ